MLQALQQYDLDSRSVHVRVHLTAEICETRRKRNVPQIDVTTLLRQRSYVVDQVPQFVRGNANALQRHVTLPGLQRAE